jgi:hypothetical protein
LKSLKVEVLKKTTVVDLKVDVWCQIYKFGYGELLRKEEDESTKVQKEISIVDQGEGRRTIDQVLVDKFRSTEEDQGFQFGEEGCQKIQHSGRIHSRYLCLWREDIDC